MKKSSSALKNIISCLYKFFNQRKSSISNAKFNIILYQIWLKISWAAHKHKLTSLLITTWRHSLTHPLVVALTHNGLSKFGEKINMSCLSFNGWVCLLGCSIFYKKAKMKWHLILWKNDRQSKNCLANWEPNWEKKCKDQKAKKYVYSDPSISTYTCV